MVGAEQRPEIEQFAEGSAQEESALSTPFDLEGNIRALVEQERARHQQSRVWFEGTSGGKEPEFNAALWMRGEIEGIVGRMVVTETPEQASTLRRKSAHRLNG